MIKRLSTPNLQKPSIFTDITHRKNYKPMKTNLFILAFCVCNVFGAMAQQPAPTKIRFMSDLSGSCNCTASLMWYEVQFIEAPAGGLADTRYESVTTFDPEKDGELTTSLRITKPQILNLVISPKSGSISDRQRKNRFLKLFVIPKNDIGIRIDSEGKVNFSGLTADYQNFLQENFAESVYQYLPKFGFDPNRPDNPEVVRRIDSLQIERKKRYTALRQNIAIDSSFDAYIRAEMMTEPYMVRVLVKAKEMHKQGQLRLSKQQDEALNNHTLTKFKLLPDDALLSEGYRNELFNYGLIQTTNKFPADTFGKFVLKDEGVQFGYEFAENYLKEIPTQKEYIQTRWLDYATSLLTSMKTAQYLFGNYKQEYPNSVLLPYFERQIEGKSKLESGLAAPQFKLKDKDGKDVSLTSLKGKKLCLAFCFNLKQHEQILRETEEKYADKLTIVYVTLMSSIPFDYWKDNVSAVRTGALHLYAPDEIIDDFKNNYLATNPYPFVLINENGNIYRRWIPQEFPMNKTLQNELSTWLGN